MYVIVNKIVYGHSYVCSSVYHLEFSIHRVGLRLVVLKILTKTTLKRQKEYVVCQKEKKINNWKRKAMILLKYLMLYHGTKRKLSARNHLFAC